MARVIKAGAGQKPARPPARVLVDSGGKKVIEREVYQAKQDAEHILRRAEEERQEILAEGRRRAAQAREEAMARGASEAFASAAGEALLAFRRRAERYAEAADDIRIVALEVVKKILGTDPDVGPKDVERVMQRGLAQLRARRRLRLQVSARRLAELGGERPNLMKALQSEPDLVVESVPDVGVGFARVVTEVGGALCAEETALDALSSAVNVHEQPRPRMERRAVEETQVGTGPMDVEALRRALRASEGRRETAQTNTNVRATPSRHRSSPVSEPSQAIEELHARDDGAHAAPGARPGASPQAAAAPRGGAVRVDVDRAWVRPGAGGAVSPSPSSSTAGLRPRHPASRARPIDASEEDDSTVVAPPLPRGKPPPSEPDDELDLFMDAAVTPGKRS